MQLIYLLNSSFLFYQNISTFALSTSVYTIFIILQYLTKSIKYLIIIQLECFMIQLKQRHIKPKPAGNRNTQHNHTLEQMKEEIITPQKKASYVFYDIQLSNNEFDSSGMKGKKPCRICFQLQDIDKLIIPCKCMQNKKYVHQQCLIEWIVKQVHERKVKKTDINIIKCELCQQLFKFRILSRYRSSCSILIKSLQQKGWQQILTWILLFFISICLLLAVSIISFMNLSSQGLYISNQVVKIIVLTIAIILTVIEIILCTVFMNQNFVYLQIIIVKVYNFYDPIQITHSNSSSSEENYPIQYFIVTRK